MQQWSIKTISRQQSLPPDILLRHKSLNKLIIKNIKAVIFDWAGTIIDYGCMAPAQVFIEVFRKRDIIISMEEARGSMGVAKKDHVCELFRIDTIQKQWIAEFGRIPSENDVEEIYSELAEGKN